MNKLINGIPRDLIERAWRQLANYDTGRLLGAYLDADPCAPECSETCVRSAMCTTCSAMLAAAPKAEQSPVQEPFGWYTEDHLTDKSATTYDWAIAERWAEKGWPLWPLYAAPTQPQSDDAMDGLVDAEGILMADERDTLRKQLDEARELLDLAMCKPYGRWDLLDKIDAWLEATKK